MRLQGTSAARWPLQLRDIDNGIFARLLCAAPFVLLTQWSGTPQGLCEGVTRLAHQSLTLLFVLCCCLFPLRRGPRLVSQMRRAWEQLPLPILLGGTGWLGCLAWSAWSSRAPRLATEMLGYNAWLLLLAALFYGVVSVRPNVLDDILNAVLLALDLLVLRVAAHFAMSLFVAGDSALLQLLACYSLSSSELALYASLLLPLTIWRAAHSASAQNFLQKMWRTMRPFALVLLCVSASAFVTGVVAIALTALVFWLALRPSQKTATSVTAAHLPALNITHLAALLAAFAFILIGARTLSDTAFWSTDSQLALWSNAAQMINARPLTGFGAGTFPLEQLQFVRPGAPRVLSADAANMLLQRASEEGIAALLCWMSLITGVVATGLLRWFNARRGGVAFNSTQRALLCGLLFYVAASGFAAREATPIIGLHFYLLLALLAATLWPLNETGPAELSTAKQRVLRLSATTSRWTVRLICIIALAASLLAAPHTIRATYAQLIYDDALNADSLPRRVALLRQARDLDLAQPLYWAQLAQAQYEMYGTPVARAATNLYRAAALRSPSDALLWHNIAALFGTAGDAPNVVRNETRAMLRDPTFAPYQQGLSNAYAQLKNTRKADAHARLAEQFAARGHQFFDAAQIGARYRRRMMQPEYIALPDRLVAPPIRDY